MAVDKMEAVFEVRSIHACAPNSHGGGAMRIVGDLMPAGDTARVQEFVEPLLGNFVIIARRKDGTVPLRLGQKLRVIIEDPEAPKPLAEGDGAAGT
jgi:hypothetical protein